MWIRERVDLEESIAPAGARAGGGVMCRLPALLSIVMVIGIDRCWGSSCVQVWGRKGTNRSPSCIDDQ